ARAANTARSTADGIALSAAGILHERHRELARRKAVRLALSATRHLRARPARGSALHGACRSSRPPGRTMERYAGCRAIRVHAGRSRTPGSVAGEATRP